jgi:hypothetical protein
MKKIENSLDSIRGIMEYGKINYKTEENIQEILGTVKMLNVKF